MKRKGFTLIEIMVVVAIISVIAAGILTVATRSLNAYYTVSALNELSNNASFAMDEIIRDLRQASRVEPASDGNSMLVYYKEEGNGETDVHVISYYISASQDDIPQLIKYSPSDLTERVLCNYIVIREGSDIFYETDNYVSIELILSKAVAITQRTVTFTLNSRTVLRN